MKLKNGKKTGLKYFDMAYIREQNPCYDPVKYLPENFKGTALDILKHPNIPMADKLWLVLRADIVSEKCMRLFAVWSVRQVVLKTADPRTIKALDVAEAFTNGEVSEADLAAAESAAWSAASAARSASRSAARSAASASRSAASAARSAAESAAWSAASASRSAARSAAESAARSAASAARSASRSAARSAAEKAQVEKLIEMVTIEGQQYIDNKESNEQFKKMLNVRTSGAKES